MNWNHRFDSLQADLKEVTASVEELGGTSTGYIVPHWESTVKNRRDVQAQYLVGTDGHNSLVRHRTGLESELFGGPEFFAAYEFETNSEVEGEIRVVLDDASTNVLWPLAGNRCRWTFQLSHPRPPLGLP